VKFAKEGSQVETLQQSDRMRAELVFAIRKVSRIKDTLQKSIAEKHAEMLKFYRGNQKERAKTLLRSKKVLEAQFDKMLTSLENLNTLESTIESMHVNKIVRREHTAPSDLLCVPDG
jgi:hypothetical protein